MGKLPNKTKTTAEDFNVLLTTDNDEFGGNAELHQMARNMTLNNIY